MKNSILKNAVALSVFFCVLFSINSNLKAQSASCNSPYTIINNTSCLAVVNFEFKCNGNICFSLSNISVGPGTHNITLPPSCTSCQATGCDAKLTLLKINNVPMGSPYVDMNHVSDTFTPPASCSGALGTLTWTATDISIN